MEDKEYKDLVQFMSGYFRRIEDQIDDLRKNSATKEDLERFSTKDDIEAIRGELQKFATKDDIEAISGELQKFVTKADLEIVRGEIKDFANQNIILHEDTHRKIQTVIEGLQSSNESRARDKEALDDTIAKLERREMFMMDDIMTLKADVKALKETR